MYLTSVKRKSAKGKVYTTWLLRRSYRVGSKVKTETVGRLTDCSDEEIQAIKRSLDQKGKPGDLSPEAPRIMQGKSIGAAWVIYKVASSLGIVEALGNSFQGQLALWLIIARIIAQGSRLSAVRLGETHDIASVIKLKRGLDENDLYDSLRWLSKNQADVEDQLYRRNQNSSRFFWYDVTSTYLEGEQNALAAFGYNRDQKERKRQIVVGLLCQQQGHPISIEAFRGNTQDTQTVSSQLLKLSKRFDRQKVVLVGDRGMIRPKQMKELNELNFNYITALSMPQIQGLINHNVIKMEDFGEVLKSVTHKGLRYIYRRNPQRAQKTMCIRDERVKTVQARLNKENLNLKENPKISVFKAKSRMAKYIKKLCVHEWVEVRKKHRQLYLHFNLESLREKSKMDGCYVWTTDLPIEEASDLEVYQRYKDLKYVEDAFRDSKTAFLEMRPVYVRTEESTKGHLLVLMLAYAILKELKRAWFELDVTVEEGLVKLSTVCQNTLEFASGVKVHCIPEPCLDVLKLLNALGISLPKTLDVKEISVVTRKKTKKRI